MKKRLTSFPASIQNARIFRKKQTPAETVLWNVLRNRRTMGAKFRRQHPVGRFVLDFFCREKHIAIEVDGKIHQKKEIAGHDLERSKYLEEQGIRIIRFTNNQVLQELQKVITQIQIAIEQN